MIIEGPSKWTVRPVAEVFYEKRIWQGGNRVRLVGLIWQVREDLSFDAGASCLTNGQPVNGSPCRNDRRVLWHPYHVRRFAECYRNRSSCQRL